MLLAPLDKMLKRANVDMNALISISDTGVSSGHNDELHTTLHVSIDELSKRCKTSFNIALLGSIREETA